MKKVSRLLGRMEASLNGSLDGLQLDNTADVIEKSLVIEMVNDLKMLVNEAQTEVKNISSMPVLTDSLPAGTIPKEEYDIAVNEIGQLQEQLKEAEEYIRDLSRGTEH